MRGVAADAGTMFRSHVLPALLTLWGMLILASALRRGVTGDGAYAGGQYLAWGLAIAMIVLGVRALVRARTS